MRDTTLARALVARGHELEFLSLYTPVRADTPPPGRCRIFYGGVNVYLEQRFGLFRHAPAFLERLFDSEWLLDFIGRFVIDTKAEGLGEMTVSVLRGGGGRQAGELERLVHFLKSGPRPDVVHITNSLLSAIAPAVKEALGVPVVSNLQGEDAFIERLGEPWRTETVALIRRHAEAVDRFVAPGDEYADDMAEFLAVERSRIAVIRPGIDLAAFAGKHETPDDTFRIGYLSRITPLKGIDLLCEAFRRLERERPGASTLEVAGEVAPAERDFWEGELRRLSADGLGDRVRYVGSPDLAGKLGFLKRLSVFALPSRTGERQAIACLEALAAGCPVVLSDHGMEREIVSLTGGGLLVKPNDAQALAEGLARLRDDAQLARALGERGAAGARAHFSSDVMVEKTIELYGEVCKA
jgi:glycosyltransferase involved in cell wall biosynthesis